MDTLRLAVAPVDDDGDGGGFQVQVYVNDLEVTVRGAGLGMDPYDVLVPANRFVASEEPRVVPVARCRCGVYGCAMTDARIARESDRVRWDFEEDVPMSRPVFFEARAYEEELSRVDGDHSWETPDRTAGRLVLSSVGAEDLPFGLEFDWVGQDWQDPGRLQVCLRVRGDHQVFVGFDWLDRSPQELACEVRRALTTEPPARWPATWHAVRPDAGPPAFAGPGWTQVRP